MAAAQSTWDDTQGISPAQTASKVEAAHEDQRLSWIRERAAKLATGTRVLDIGFEVPAHREVFSHCRYSFFDLCGFLASGKEGKGRSVYHVPVADGAYDVVMCSSVFEWVLKPEDALREVLRTLTPAGLVWVAPPLFTAPADAPPRASAALSFSWYAAVFARQGLEIGDAFAASRPFQEMSKACVEAGRRLSEVEVGPERRAELEALLLRDLPILFTNLDTNTGLESRTGGVVLEARRCTSTPEVAVEKSLASEPNAEPSVRARCGLRPLRITYLITSILGVTGGNITLLNQAEALRRRGHAVTIVTRSARPAWRSIEVPVVHVPRDRSMASHVPRSDAVIGTYFQNASELPDVQAKVKVYYAQGDQFVFEDDTPFPDRESEKMRQALKAASSASYRLPDVHFVANSCNLAQAVRRAHGVSAEAVLPVCTDQTIFRPLSRSAKGSRQRILVVGPDTAGGGVESLVFKGIEDIRKGLELLSETFSNFTAVRISNSSPDIFASFPCEYHYVPSDEMKTYLFGTADILVYASHFDSCPRPPQEGMAAGVAVVCTATSGATEYCVHEDNSLLVPVRDPPAIAAAISRVVRDRTLRDRIVLGGLRTAAQYPREREWNELELLLYKYAEAAGVC
jgi:glycosyltransferase involved in cell wall biosynthesis/SAM-dependent methyltransferase